MDVELVDIDVLVVEVDKVVRMDVVELVLLEVELEEWSFNLGAVVFAGLLSAEGDLAVVFGGDHHGWLEQIKQERYEK